MTRHELTYWFVCTEPWHGGSEAVRPCGGVSTGLRYCCALGLEHNGIDDYSCCLTMSNVFTIAAAATPIAIIASGTSVPFVTNSSATIATPIKTPIKTPTETPTAINAQSTTVAGSGGLSIGDKIALGVGIPATIAAIATVWQLVVMLKQRKKRRSR
jgi:hypothetical protein